MNDEKSLLTVLYANGAYGLFLYFIAYYFFLSQIRYLRELQHKYPLLRKVGVYGERRFISHVLAMTIVYIAHFFYDPQRDSVYAAAHILMIYIGFSLHDDIRKWKTAKMKKEDIKREEIQQENKQTGYFSLGLTIVLFIASLFYLLTDREGDSPFDFRDMIAQGLHVWGLFEMMLVYISLFMLWGIIGKLLYKQFAVKKPIAYSLSSGLLLLLGWWIVPFFSQVDMPLYGLMILLYITLYNNRVSITAKHFLIVLILAMILGVIYFFSLLVNTVFFS